MDFNLTEEQQAYAASARQFAEKELMPFAAEWDAQADFPLDTIHRAGEMGFLSLYTPEDHGGMGLSRLDSSIIIEELARGCTATTAYLTIHNMATWMVAMFGSEELQQVWLPKLVAGQLLASYCLTEPGSGSDAASLRTTAKSKGKHYVLNGSKMFISGAGSTEVLIVMARTGGLGPKGVSAFLVPADTQGISYGRKEEKMGWNCQPTRAITFEDVKIPTTYRLGEEGEGFTFAMKGLDGGRINIATCSVGTAQAALETARSYLLERHQFNKPLAEFQALQFKLADMTTELVAARQMVRLAAFKLDQQDPEAGTYSAMAKRFATDAGFNICNDALQLHGGYGYIREYPLERYVRDSRVHQILEGTNEIMRVIIARRILLEHSLEAIR
ncbi:acyl-CoA dehydrogenase [Hahella sp. CCB-MM4]|uniref:acyl-CoA dehydrogenase family protein n=1 Tax=Hahella sp. (strain CCB-MM4) TaxID=1926491 RepID=UPI000B9A5A1C|nr:acyl-CoA dehydrogenase family protein [Hahella sp. CCB-MM4]OZG75501.1 acyl-CoA dehydrogenase [Hahella sp. CCB-MM4]